MLIAVHEMSDSARWLLLSLILLALAGLLAFGWTDALNTRSLAKASFVGFTAVPRTSAFAGAASFAVAWVTAWQMRLWTDMPRWLSTGMLAAVCAVAAAITCWYAWDIAQRGMAMHLLLWVTCFMLGVLVDVMVVWMEKAARHS